MSMTRKFERGGPALWFVVTMNDTGEITELEEHDWREGGLVKDDATPAEREAYLLKEAPRRWTDSGALAATEAFLTEMRVALESQAAINLLPAGRQKRLVIAVDELLSYNLGSADAYLGSIGLPATRKLQHALADYGITPDYGQSIGQGLRSRSRT